MLEGKPLPTIWDVPDDLWERRGRFSRQGFRDAPEASMKTAGLLLTSLMFPVASAKLIPASASLSLAEGLRKGATTIRMESPSVPGFPGFGKAEGGPTGPPIC